MEEHTPGTEATSFVSYQKKKNTFIQFIRPLKTKMGGGGAPRYTAA